MKNTLMTQIPAHLLMLSTIYLTACGAGQSSKLTEDNIAASGKGNLLNCRKPSGGQINGCDIPRPVVIYKARDQVDALINITYNLTCEEGAPLNSVIFVREQGRNPEKHYLKTKTKNGTISLSTRNDVEVFREGAPGKKSEFSFHNFNYSSKWPCVLSISKIDKSPTVGQIKLWEVRLKSDEEIVTANLQIYSLLSGLKSFVTPTDGGAGVTLDGTRLNNLLVALKLRTSVIDFQLSQLSDEAQKETLEREKQSLSTYLNRLNALDRDVNEDQAIVKGLLASVETILKEKKSNIEALIPVLERWHASTIEQFLEIIKRIDTNLAKGQV